MTLQLRPHHLLCILTYIGKGYSPAFITNFNEVISRIAAGEKFLLVEGPDDICSPLSSEPDAHCFNDSVRERDEEALIAIRTLLDTPIEIKSHFSLSADHVVILRDSFALAEDHKNSIRQACINCQWSPLCTTIATEGYHQTRLFCPE